MTCRQELEKVGSRSASTMPGGQSVILSSEEKMPQWFVNNWRAFRERVSLA